MKEQTRNWLDEHKEDVIFLATSAALGALAVSAGYKLGSRMTMKHVNSKIDKIIPAAVDEAGFLGFVNTMEFIEEVTPAAVDKLEEIIGSDMLVTKAVSKRFRNDTCIRELVKGAKEACLK